MYVKLIKLAIFLDPYKGHHQGFLLNQSIKTLRTLLGSLLMFIKCEMISCLKNSYR